MKIKLCKQDLVELFDLIPFDFSWGGTGCLSFGRKKDARVNRWNAAEII